MGPNQSYITLLHNWCAHPWAINIRSMIECFQMNSNCTLITWWNKWALPTTSPCHSSAVLTCNRSQGKRHLQDNERRGQKDGQPWQICPFWFPKYFQQVYRYDFCGKLIRFRDCSRYSSGNSQCHDPKKKKTWHLTLYQTQCSITGSS